MKGKIFNAQEVQAILNGSKVMSREVIKNQPCIELGSGTIERSPISDSIFYWKGSNNYSMFSFGKCPYQVGQKIFCKESFNLFAGQVSYKQDLVGAERYFWRPAKHMKQEHSRLTLLIKEIGVERLQDISPEDYLKEGIKRFASNWNATHKKPEEKFEANPWVWCVLFTTESELLDWKDLLGIAPNATGGLSSEEFVRNLRNEWE